MFCRVCIVVLLAFGFLAPAAQAQELAPPGFVADLEVHTAAEFFATLQRAETLFLQDELSQGDIAVSFVLHGPEVRSLLRQNYLNHRALVDLAARLSALGVVDIRVCETWMGGNGVDSEQLQPFVTTVAYGPAEIQRLQVEQGFLNF